MSGLFGNLETSKRALNAHQAGISTTSHNIANSDTEGYSRQQVVLKSTLPENKIFGQVGSGVDIKEIKRQTDKLLYDHYIYELGQSGEWDRKDTLLQELEAIMNEPSDFGMSKNMNEFFNVWSDLANHPELKSLKISVIEKTKNMTDNFHRLDSQLNNLRYRIEEQVVDRVERFNELAEEVRKLNIGVANVEYSQNLHANDLRDQRDKLVAEMAQIGDVKATEMKGGMVKVTLGGMSVVESDQIYKIELNKKLSTFDYDRLGVVFPDFMNKTARIEGGELKGLMDIRDDYIVEQMKKLDAMAIAFVQEVNTLHRKGYGSENQLYSDIPFFNTVISGARDIQVNMQLEKTPELVAASATGAPGDNQIALAISQLKDQKVMENGTMTFSRYYETIINNVGLKADQATKNKKNQDILTEQVKNFKESASGVQLDAELTNLIRLQSAYQAAARVVTTVDKLLDTIINRMGG